MAEVSYIDRIISLVKSYFDQIATYAEPYVYTDFEDDDIPNVRTVNQLIDIGTSTAILAPIRLSFATGTALPITVNYTPYVAYGNDPGIQVKYRATGQIITTPTINLGNTDNPITSFTVDAANNGTGLTDGDIIIVIKQ